MTIVDDVAAAAVEMMIVDDAAAAAVAAAGAAADDDDSVPKWQRTADAVKECDPEDSATAIAKECDWRRRFLIQADAD